MNFASSRKMCLYLGYPPSRRWLTIRKLKRKYCHFSPPEIDISHPKSQTVLIMFYVDALVVAVVAVVVVLDILLDVVAVIILIIVDMLICFVLFVLFFEFLMFLLL